MVQANYVIAIIVIVLFVILALVGWVIYAIQNRVSIFAREKRELEEDLEEGVAPSDFPDTMDDKDDLPLRLRAACLRQELVEQEEAELDGICHNSRHASVVTRQLTPPLSYFDEHHRKSLSMMQVVPATPPASPPLRSLVVNHQTSKSQSVGTMAMSSSRPLTPPRHGDDDLWEKGTTSGKLWWEDNRDSWF